MFRVCAVQRQKQLNQPLRDSSGVDAVATSKFDKGQTGTARRDVQARAPLNLRQTLARICAFGKKQKVTETPNGALTETSWKLSRRQHRSG
jgi:hypothetical protein